MSLHYELPPELIAQHPVEPRSNSRMLVFHRDSGRLEHRKFYEIVEFFDIGDVFVFNNTKVIKARLLGHKKTGAKIEVLLLKKIQDLYWEALVRPLKRLRNDHKIYFDGDDFAEIENLDSEADTVLIKFHVTDWDLFLKKNGHIPLPPYIQRSDEPDDHIRYQTIFAEEEGAVAAPTAGLHFDQNIYEKIQNKGILPVKITLHVGLGTFQPVKPEQIQKKELHSESYVVTHKTVQAVNQAFSNKRKVLSIGTTVVRTLESTACGFHQINASHGMTKLFIQPGYVFQATDCVLTNFHLPGSSLLYLVEALIGENALRAIYNEAIQNKYRFYSYGDCCLIL